MEIPIPAYELKGSQFLHSEFCSTLRDGSNHDFQQTKDLYSSTTVVFELKPERQALQTLFTN